MDRFWNKVNKTEDCWKWLGCKNQYGYGVFRLPKQQKNILAHRYAWISTFGDIPNQTIVRHKCRGKCVNPSHLELGTQKDNGLDMIRDGTSNRGEKHIFAKLTDEQVLEIKQRLQDYYRGLSVELAKEYNVSYTTISEIKNDKRWSWLNL